MMASAQAVETSVNQNNSPSQDYTTNPDDHSNHNTFHYRHLYAAVIENTETVPKQRMTRVTTYTKKYTES